LNDSNSITMAMTLSEVSAFAYSGSLEELPPSASPGLLFLKAWISKVDSLSNDDSDGEDTLLSPTAMVIYNAKPPQPAHAKAVKDHSQRKREKRSAALQSIRREFQQAWDIDNGDGTRNVVYESRNIFYFAADPDNPVVMPEASRITLERVSETVASDSKASDNRVKTAPGIAGFWATEFRSWHDRVGMLKKREELGC
jgi:hypothetical protein